ncbi:hypothetical protein HPB49_002286 [Dermacentor silvarum]|uniref:Uncharacterized protein n=1 Tax=Dermacentor silvarum TaxID=543639 RepID=A0ACB8CUF4_DERSI|nr:uncharacterized protein LOC119450680 isoform X1 [Dermacentor silvarum]KAH7952880.1 hypothetical protein HPB49_002286 [Dermacentor silvarum]
MPRFMRATQRTRLLLVLVVAFAVLFICGVAEDNDRRSAVRSTLATLLEGGGGEASSGNDALSVAAAPEELHRSQSVRQVVHGDSRSAFVRGDSSASVAAIGMVHQESVEQRQNAAVWQGQAVTVVGLLGLTVFAVIVAVVGRKLYRSRRERRNGVSCVQQASPSSSSTLALNGASRSRLFSRDRLNTTDYMHTLATLDRRLAMDEILEKRRRAVFLQQIRCHAPGDEDDVFLEEGLFCPEPAGGAPSSRHTTTPTNVDDTATTSRMQHGATPLL